MKKKVTTDGYNKISIIGDNVTTVKNNGDNFLSIGDLSIVQTPFAIEVNGVATSLPVELIGNKNLNLSYINGEIWVNDYWFDQTTQTFVSPKGAKRVLNWLDNQKQKISLLIHNIRGSLFI